MWDPKVTSASGTYSKKGLHEGYHAGIEGIWYLTPRSIKNHHQAVRAACDAMGGNHAALPKMDGVFMHLPAFLRHATDPQRIHTEIHEMKPLSHQKQYPNPKP